jgi:hypothetical protein
MTHINNINNICSCYYYKIHHIYTTTQHTAKYATIYTTRNDTAGNYTANKHTAEITHHTIT